jgi:tetratricopeptide (TPR) repeat protein
MRMAELKRERDCVEHGNLRDSQGLYEKAVTAYDYALKIDPEDADAWFDKGDTLQKMGKLAEAQKCFELAIKMYVGD